jgi:hypothetical protein
MSGGNAAVHSMALLTNSTGKNSDSGTFKHAVEILKSTLTTQSLSGTM